jgi:hypothetical protein
MAPIAVQCFFSLSAANAQRSDSPSPPTADQRDEMWKMNLNTCHVWAEDSDVVAGLRDGVSMGVPVFLRGRLAKLGVESDDWAPWGDD